MSAERCRIDELSALVTQQTNGGGGGVHKTAIPQLEFMRESEASTGISGVAEPILAIVVQGNKEALLGKETYRHGETQYLLVSVDLPDRGLWSKRHQSNPIWGSN